ncbi:MAG: DUF1501 domain-containing protein [Dehalococcoidia bacterium]|nr:DUF1501 domain-containing protein [Dehalococcoidia bacterium]
MDITRRDFLKTGVTLLGATALLPNVFQKALLTLQQERVRGAPIDDGRILVVVQMAGGNDGLNTVIPIMDGRYYDARPTISIGQKNTLPLDANTGLNPSLLEMKELWDQGILAIVEGVGYPSQNYSHFVSMDVWQTGDPKHKLNDGWLGRYCEKYQGQHEAPFLGLAIGRSLPTSLQTPSIAVPSVDSLSTYKFLDDTSAPALSATRHSSLLELYRQGNVIPSYGALLERTIQAAETSTAILQKAHALYKPAVQYPSNPLSSALQIVAEAIAYNTGVKICHVSIGGFDTHADQVADQSRQLGYLSTSLHAFYSDLKAQALDSKVLIMTWSEFGRRVKGNGSQGTDHGSAAPLFFLGTPVKGGLYGQRPSLESLDNGNLRFTVDFRSAYASALENWLGVPSQDILGGSFEPLPILSKG